MIAALLGASPPALAQHLQIASSEKLPIGGQPQDSHSFSVTLVPSHPSEASAGGIYKLSGMGVSAVPPGSLIFDDGFESGDTSSWSATVPEPTALPRGAVTFFNAAVCPSGWSVLNSARGRTLVAVPAGGTLGGTVLSELTNLSDGVHSHSVNGSIDIEPGGQHNHWWAYLFAGERRWISYTAAFGQQTLVTWGNGMGNEGSGVYPFTHTLEQRPFLTNYAGYHDHTMPFNENLDQTTAILPYLQLLACEKD